jgi:hypothetical protein
LMAAGCHRSKCHIGRIEDRENTTKTRRARRLADPLRALCPTGRLRAASAVHRATRIPAPEPAVSRDINLALTPSPHHAKMLTVHYACRGEGMDTITVSIPSAWIQGTGLDRNGLREVVMLGLRQWRQQHPQEINARVIRTLLGTGRIKHLAPSLVESAAPDDARQTPPILPGPAVSEILVAQRRGEL